MKNFVENNLKDLAKEIVDWKATGLLHSGEGGKLRELARMFQNQHSGTSKGTTNTIDFSSALRVAETMVVDACLENVARSKYELRS